MLWNALFAGSTFMIPADPFQKICAAAAASWFFGEGSFTIEGSFTMTTECPQQADMADQTFGISLSEISNHIRPLQARILMAKPFGRLVRFESEESRRRPRVLLIAPLSGHRSILLDDMIVALAQDHDLHLVEWADASKVALSAGRFGLDGNIGYLVDFLRFLGDDLHLIGLCQSALPSIAATAVAAMGGTTAPRSMTLLGGKIDPRNSPTRGDLLAKRQSIPWLEQNCMIRVASSDAGMGRLVYPASIQKAALLAYLTRHLLAGGELFGKLMKDDGEYAAGRPFLDLFFSVADLPAEFFLETIVSVFQRFDFPRGRLIWQGEKIEPAAITRTALFTIEGAQDDVSGPGQTNVAHDLCANIPKLWRESYVQSGVGHFGLFHGAIWRSTILPRVRRFIRAQDRKKASGLSPPPSQSNPSSIIA